MPSGYACETCELGSCVWESDSGAADLFVCASLTYWTMIYFTFTLNII